MIGHSSAAAQGDRRRFLRLSGRWNLYRKAALALQALALWLAACGSAGGQAAQTPLPTTGGAPKPAQTSPSAAPTLAPSVAPPPTSPNDAEAPTTNLPLVQGGLRSFPDPDRYRWNLVADGFRNPVGLANADDGSGRLFVLEQAGIIRVMAGGEALREPFLDISAQVGCCGERGLLGLAFHPEYERNGFFYINYTDLNGDTVIARFTISADPNRADPQSETRLLFVPQPYPNHNGGEVTFGPDGYLYLGLGDGGSAGDPQGHGQNPGALLGKILRLDVDGGEPYAIPPDNPFAEGGGAPEVWAYGLRNPWRFSFDEPSGDLYIADVGQNAWEEIDFLPAGSPAGANFGWNYREGSHPFEGQPPEGLELIDPVAEYDHSLGCSVTGGFVYRGESLPAWQGVYLYGDYCSGLLWGLLRGEDGAWQERLLYETGARLSSFGEDERGEIYFSDYAGSIYRLEER